MAETTPSALQELETRRHELAGLLRNAAARAAADADRLDAVDLEKWIMANATQLVTELLDKAKADEARIAELQKQLDDLTAKDKELEPRGVDQSVLDNVDSFLHPTKDGGSDPLIPPPPAPL